MNKFVLWLGIVGALLSMLVSLALFFSGADLEGIAARGEILKLLTDAPGGPMADEIAHLNGLHTTVSHLSLWHFGTSVALLVVSIIGLRLARKLRVSLAPKQ